MNKILSILLLTFLFSNSIFAQEFSIKKKDNAFKNPVTFKTHTEKINDKEYYLVFDATIEKDWHLYSQYNPEGASMPMTFSSEEADSLFVFVDKALESKTHTAFNKQFGKEEIFFSKKGTFKQKIKLLKNNVKKISVSLFGQACKEACIIIDPTFEFDLTKAGPVTKMPIADAQISEYKEKKAEELKTSSKDNNKKKSLLTWFIIGLLGGLAALLTPCMYPMIPMTVSFFTKQSKTKADGIKNAFIYGLFIIGVYVALGYLVVLFFGADALNILAANPWFNILVFVVIIIFALSFLGAFEIMLPNSWANSLDAKADKGGFIGIFFMALLLAVVSFSCTGPIVGISLVSAAANGGLAPLIVMLGFGIGVALPFTIFAAFPGWMNSLPKSGGWLNTVKVFLGFLELALAFKFLSNADLVWDTHFLEREVFISIWIAVFGTLAFYLFGKIQLPHDSPIRHISVGRLILGLFVLTFTIYLIPGLWGAPLKIISGFPPPLKYSESPYGVGYSKGNSVALQELPEGAVYGPHDIPSFEDYAEGLAYAKEIGKPILLDFTGKACVNCRKMEEQVWSDPKILKILKNDIVLISLFVDLVKPLPKEERYISKTTGKKIKTYGNKWSDFQISRYKANAQPYYVILNLKEETQNGYTSYDPDVKKYYNWLKEGVEKAKK